MRKEKYDSERSFFNRLDYISSNRLSSLSVLTPTFGEILIHLLQNDAAVWKTQIGLN